MNWEDIIVSSKVLGHISAGVYRTTAGALKELVSNAFDADATRVVITTNHPSFDIITCRDNGSGIKLKDFKRIMKGGIGDSLKRVETEQTAIGRPVIGRLGIGMLGIAQVCHQFKIISHHKETQTAFQATVKLADYLREKIDEVNPEDERQHQVGKFTIEEVDYDENQAGTYVVASDMRAAFVRKFRNNPTSDSSPLPKLPSKFSSFLDRIHRDKSVRELGDYWQMVWGLAVACPVPYISNSPFKWEQVDASPQVQEYYDRLQAALQSYQFELVVDGLSLRKPVSLPCPLHKRNSEELLSGKLFLINESLTIYGRPLNLFGYIFLQDGQAIEPMELRGILIRIRNIAIGGYDPTFLNYPKIEGPRFNWLTGEVYVTEGLEHALNIDRDSFNEMHPHFEALQKKIHNLLEEVFQKAGEGIKERSAIKHEKEEQRKQHALQQVIKDELQQRYKVIKSSGLSQPIIIDDQKKKVIIDEQNSLWPKAKSKREIAEIIGIAYELSMLAPNNQRRERFYELLSQVLDL